MKQLIEDLKTVIDKYNKENNCVVEKIEVNTQIIESPMCEKRIVGYNLTIIVNSL